jgi:D-serine deaminase-like pyridoxal phosphate-dependent protein
MPQSLIGRNKAELETPFLSLDIEAFERNIAAFATAVQAHGKAWRPHSKGHKSPIVAWKQIAAGALGITCAKLGEAEVLASSGLQDLLIANMLVGERRCERLAALCRLADPIVCCDHYAQAEPLSAICHRRGVRCRCLVDVNIGMNRTGIRPGSDALELAQAIDRLPGLTLVGIMGYEGHLMQVANPQDKAHQVQEALGILDHCRSLLRQHGLRCDIVSAGGTGSLNTAPHCQGITEIQGGGGIFGDLFYRENCGVAAFEPALTVRTTVISRPSLDRAILDAGRKTMSVDLHPPAVKDWPDAIVTGLSAEHCTLQLGPESRRLRIGDPVEMLVGYHDYTVVLHDEFYVFRDETLQAMWPIAARGRLQ